MSGFLDGLYIVVRRGVPALGVKTEPRPGHPVGCLIAYTDESSGADLDSGSNHSSLITMRRCHVAIGLDFRLVAIRSCRFAN